MLNEAEAIALRNLCSAGRLYEVEELIRSRSIELPPGFKPTPLHVAITRGFYSLVELLLRQEPSVATKTAALNYAVKRHRLDIAQLVLTHGASPSSLDMVDVIRAATSIDEVMYFIRLGADITSNAPIALAMSIWPSRKIVGILKQCLAEKPAIATPALAQANALLRTYCARGPNEWIRPLLKAGANPEVEAPRVEDLHRKRPSNYPHSAYLEACLGGNIEALRILRPRLDDAELSRMLEYASWGPHAPVIEYLVGIGAPVNDAESGTSNALSSCLFCLGLSERREGAERAVKVLLDRGAKWNLERTSIAEFHNILASLPGATAPMTMELLVAYSATGDETLQYLVSRFSHYKRWAEYLPSLTALLRLQPKQRLKAFLKTRPNAEEEA